ncbi:MAG TPA: TonB-dependent receptor plug domain-containing protein [Gemmatimonadaceae bacterium]|nr:TonB-dependent receptor plug domain-containing protein [Gemmatimonadaceae bacterium]
MPDASHLLVPASLVAAMLTACSHGPKPAGKTPPARDADVTAEDLRSSPARSVEQQLMAKVPGITVSRTSSGGLAIRIRGGGSLYGNNSPLYVIDGLAVDAGPEGEMPGISAYDIESIRVLKDTEAMTLYGSRGEHGVIIINTKRSNKQQKTPN